MSEIALLGKKIGMTREFYKSGQLVPVTVLKVEKARVIQVIEEGKRGYNCLLYTSPSPRDTIRSRMPSSA